MTLLPTLPQSSLDVIAAFTQWQQANLDPSGALPPRATTFTKIDSGTPTIELKHRRDMGTGPNGGMIVAETYMPDQDVSPVTGFSPKADIEVDREEVTAVPYYKKVLLHEIGHANGLFDFPFGRSLRPSVMRGSPPTENDLGGYMPEVVTECDRKMAREALLGTLPRQ